MVHKDSNRPRRIAELIKRELAQMIARELDDPIAHRVTLTGARVSADLSIAKVYFSVLGGAAEAKAATSVLNHAAGFLRHELAHRMRLRTVPQLRFFFDTSIEQGARVSSLIERALAEDRTHKPD